VSTELYRHQGHVQRGVHWRLSVPVPIRGNLRRCLRRQLLCALQLRRHVRGGDGCRQPVSVCQRHALRGGAGQQFGCPVHRGRHLQRPVWGHMHCILWLRGSLYYRVSGRPRSRNLRGWALHLRHAVLL